MGFDLYGMKPKTKEKAPKLPAWDAEDNEETQNARKKYFDWQENTPGVYFRNNVWGWRPLWFFVSRACDDILTSKDCHAGEFNDGHRISKTKAEKIAKRLYQMLEDGNVDKFEAEFEDNNGYGFHKDNVKEFADFCANCGGFEIC